MFWRRGFWTRPAFLVAYAGVALGLAVGFSYDAVGALRAQRAVEAGRVCGGHVRLDCLETASGTLTGPFRVRRSTHRRWAVVVDGERSGRIELERDDSDDLAIWAGAEVDVVVHDGRLLTVIAPDGATFDDIDSGYRGVALSVSGALTLLILALGVARHARRKSSAYDGWWRYEGPPVEFTDARVALAGGMPASVFVLILVDVPWYAALTVPAFVLLAVLGVVLDERRGRRLGRDHD